MPVKIVDLLISSSSKRFVRGFRDRVLRRAEAAIHT